MLRRLAALTLTALLAVAGVCGHAAAQGVTVSPAPDRVAVTVYRDTSRSDGPLDLNWLEGYALISETRTVTIPAGASEIRFEGVAGGILPQSAIVTGLPDGIVERNRDAYLLSPGTLYDRSLGRRVQLRRTSRATGQVREQDAVIRSSLDGGVVVETAEGIESLRCTGLPETLVYPSVPADLAARPTLSVRTRASQTVTATVTLSYLATGFDWEAFYIATLAPDGDSAELFGWLTLANGDETSFVNASTQAVAGRLEREETRAPEIESAPLRLECWPAGITSDPEGDDLNSLPQLLAPPPPPPPPASAASSEEFVVVTGSRIPLQAEQENLGDVKLYRIPEPVTLAARSQKQVAMIQRPRVAVRMVYRHRFPGVAEFTTEPARRILVTRNRGEEGLGLPLPAGRLALFTIYEGRPILLGEGHVGDRAVGEDVEVELGRASGVTAVVRRTATTASDGSGDYEVVVTNDMPAAVRYEAEIADRGLRLRSRTRLTSRNGRRLWQVNVPANGTATLRYRVER